MLDKEVLIERNFNPEILLRMSQYSQYISSYIKLEWDLRSLAKERESQVFMLRLISQTNNLKEFVTKLTQFNLLKSLRKLTCKIVKLWERSLKFKSREQCSSEGNCVIKKIQKEALEIQGSTLVIRRLSVFLEDLIVFIKRENDEVLRRIDKMNSLAQEKKSVNPFTINEITQFEKVLTQLRNIKNIDKLKHCCLVI